MVEVYARVDLGGSKFACAFATGDRNVVVKKTIPTESQQGPQAVLAHIVAWWANFR